MHAFTLLSRCLGNGMLEASEREIITEYLKGQDNFPFFHTL